MVVIDSAVPNSQLKNFMIEITLVIIPAIEIKEIMDIIIFRVVANNIIRENDIDIIMPCLALDTKANSVTIEAK